MRLIAIEKLKSEALNSHYDDEDFRANPYKNSEELYEMMRIDSLGPHAKTLKCRELVISYIHRLTSAKKEEYTALFTLPFLADYDQQLINRRIEERSYEATHHRRLC